MPVSQLHQYNLVDAFSRGQQDQQAAALNNFNLQDAQAKSALAQQLAPAQITQANANANRSVSESQSYDIAQHEQNIKHVLPFIKDEKSYQALTRSPSWHAVFGDIAHPKSYEEARPILDRLSGNTPVKIETKAGENARFADPYTGKQIGETFSGDPVATTDMRDYAAAKAQGYKGSLLDYQKELRQSSSAQTQIKVNSFVPASEAAQKDFIDKASKSYETLSTAPVLLDNIAKAKDLVSKSAPFVGSFGEKKLGIAQFFNNNFGTSIAPEAIKNGTELKTRLFYQIMENLKKMDAQPSELQQKIMMESLGTLNTDPEALKKVMGVMEDAVKGKVNIHNRMVGSAMKRNVQFPFDPRINLNASQPESTQQPSAGTFQGLSNEDFMKAKPR